VRNQRLNRFRMLLNLSGASRVGARRHPPVVINPLTTLESIGFGTCLEPATSSTLLSGVHSLRLAIYSPRRALGRI